MSSTASTSTTPATDIDSYVTYRFRNTLVYVKQETDYDAALDIARSEYPDLAKEPRERIVFSSHASMNGTRQSIRISRSAWPSAIARMARGEVIDIALRDDKVDPPAPQHLGVPKEKSRSRTPSPTPSTKEKRGWLRNL